MRFWRVTDLDVMGVNNLGVAVVIGPERPPRAGLVLAATEGTAEEAIVCLIEMYACKIMKMYKMLSTLHPFYT